MEEDLTKKERIKTFAKLPPLSLIHCISYDVRWNPGSLRNAFFKKLADNLGIFPKYRNEGAKHYSAEFSLNTDLFHLGTMWNCSTWIFLILHWSSDNNCLKSFLGSFKEKSNVQNFPGKGDDVELFHSCSLLLSHYCVSIAFLKKTSPFDKMIDILGWQQKSNQWKWTKYKNNIRSRSPEGP